MEAPGKTHLKRPTPLPITSSRLLALVVLAALTDPWSARGQQDPIVDRGVQYLRGASMSSQAGETALMALALIKAEVPTTDASIQRALALILKRFETSAYTPERNGGAETYEASVIILMLANLDPVSYRSQIESATRYILSRQNANGSWDYWSRSFGDTSISQYAVLGLWEAENSGIADSPRDLGSRRGLVPVEPVARRGLDLPPRRGERRYPLDDRRGRR